jgi:Na+-translocating ferredoxin:NAD+ oxidoreductase RnfD subunit
MSHAVLSAAPRSTSRWAWLKPAETRWLAVILGTIVLSTCQYLFGILGSPFVLPVAIGSCMATEIVLSLAARGSFPGLQSAYMSGISLSLLTRPQAGLLWPFVVGAVLTIASKYALTYKGRHLWCPTALAVGIMLLVAPESVAVLSHQWGNHLTTNLVIWAFGFYVAWRARVFHITLTYVAAFLVFTTVRSLIVGLPLIPELAPVTGPMYQLAVFFLITDPKTNVSTRRGRIIVAVIIALGEAVIRSMADMGVGALAPLYIEPPLFSLIIIGPIAKWLDLRRSAPEAQSTNLTGWFVPRAA